MKQYKGTAISPNAAIIAKGLAQGLRVTILLRKIY